MRIASLFIRRPRLAFVVSAIITIAGLLALAACSQPEPPESSPSLTVSLAAPRQEQVVREVVASGAVAAWALAIRAVRLAPGAR